MTTTQDFCPCGARIWNNESGDTCGACRIESAAAELAVTMRADFIPFSKSRKAGEKEPSLNWRVYLERAGRPILDADYTVGIAHAPSYTPRYGPPGRFSIDVQEAIRFEAEHGHVAKRRGALGIVKGAPIPLRLAGVLYSLALDAGVIDYASFEDWASDFGYDPDSRQAERDYRACLATALKLRAAIGDDGLERLRAACEGY